MRRGAAVLLGGAVGVQALGTYASPVWYGALGLMLGAFFGVLFWRPSHFAGQWRRSESVLLVISLLVGAVVGVSGYSRLAPPLVVDRTEVEGTVTAWSIDEANCGYGAVRMASGERYILRVYPERSGSAGWGNSAAGSPQEGQELAQGWKELRPGSVIRFTAKVEQPESSRSQGTFDRRFYYATRGYEGMMTAKSEPLVVQEGSPPLVWSLRAEVRKALERWPESGPVLEAMLFGDTSRLPEEALERYKITGVLHAFAASGMHMGFVVGLVWGMMFFLPRRVRIFVCLAAIVLYMGLCDFSVSVTRAGILGAGVLLGRLGRGRSGSLRWLIWSALLLFVWNPLFLGDVSFLLSFSAVWGIVCLTPKLNELRIWRRGAGYGGEALQGRDMSQRRNMSQGRESPQGRDMPQEMGSPHGRTGSYRVPKAVRQGVCVSMAAQLAVTPVLAVTFYRISVVGLFLNVILAAVFGAVIQLGVLGLCGLALWEAAALPFFQAAIWLVEVLDRVLAAFAQLSWADMWVLQPGWIFWAAWYGLLALWLMDRRRVVFVLEAVRRRVLWAVGKWIKVPAEWLKPRVAAKQGAFGKRVLLGAVMGVLILSVWQVSVRPERVEVVFLDVGQGDCVLIRSRDVTVMVDAGPRTDSYDSAERVVVPYLLEHGIRKIDMLFITHADLDHIGGARYVLSRFPVEGVGVPALGDKLQGKAWQEGLPFDFWPDGQMVTKLAAGDCLSWGPLRVEVLGPGLGGTPGEDESSNNSSLVMRVTYKEWSVLLTGDMEKEQMKNILERSGDVNADFVKVPHHGGKGSLDENFFDYVRPMAVFIPVGRNSYGHPTPEVLEYWEARGVPVYRTDEDGTVRVILDREARVLEHGR